MEEGVRKKHNTRKILEKNLKLLLVTRRGRGANRSEALLFAVHWPTGFWWHDSLLQLCLPQDAAGTTQLGLKRRPSQTLKVQPQVVGKEAAHYAQFYGIIQ